MTIPDEAVEAGAKVLSPAAWGPRMWAYGAPGDRNAAARKRHQQESLARARAALEAAAHHIQAQALDEAVDAFPLETITAPDNAVVWMHRRAQEIRKAAGILAETNGEDGVDQ